MQFKVQTCYMEDLVLHCLAHLKVDNDSDLYNESYIEEIARKKIEYQIENTLEAKMQPLKSAYEIGFERLALINFIPFYIHTSEELENVLLKQPYFTEQDRTDFLVPFLSIVKEEEAFYQIYWAEQMEEAEDTAKRFTNRLNDFLCMFPGFTEKVTYPVAVSLQLSMTRAGRLLPTEEGVAIVGVRYPSRKEQDITSLLQIMHELTHTITDDMLKCRISMDDGTHMYAEYVVFAADYIILEKYCPELLQEYVHYLGISAFELSDLLELYPVEAKLIAQIREMF